MCKRKIGQIFTMLASGAAALSFTLPAVAQAAPPENTPVTSRAIQDSTSQEASAEIKKFINQFPAQFHQVLDEYGQTSLGGALLSRVASQSPMVEVNSNAVYFMSNGIKDGKPLLTLTERVLGLDMAKPSDRIKLMLNLTNELSTMQDAQGVWSRYIDNIEARNFLGAIEHIVMVEMASDSLQLQMAQELVNTKRYDLNAVETALYDTKNGTGFSLKGAMSAESIRQQIVSDSERELLTRALWWKFEPNSPYKNRVSDYIERMHAPNTFHNIGALEDLKKMTRYSGSYDRTPGLYDLLSGQSGFAEKMEATMAPLRPYIQRHWQGLIAIPAPSIPAQ